MKNNTTTERAAEIGEAWKGQRIVDQPDFRTYRPEWVAAGNGEEVLLQLCEELDPKSLRWEPFYATLARRARRAGQEGASTAN